jgi:leucyl aminopeptidase
MKITISHKKTIENNQILALENKSIAKTHFNLDIDKINLELFSTYSQENGILIYAQPKISGATHEVLEKYRKSGAASWKKISELEIRSIGFLTQNINENTIAFLEGLLLASYNFDRHKEKKAPKTTLEIDQTLFDNPQFKEMFTLVEANTLTKNMINEPVNILNTQQFSREMVSMGKNAGFDVEVLEKKQIEALKMGGLLAVNKGSVDPPAFNILTYKPENAVNEKPFVLVGKGVVYDTGGYNIKTDGHMNDMKLDMGGGAAVAGSLYAIAKNNLPVYVVGLVPSTDNRISGDALVADDIITMYSGTTVEVKNTDAEGRLILADALTYAKQYEPELVFDMATLTGAAMILTGDMASVIMGNATENIKDKLKSSGYNVFERVAEVPFWEEYNEMLKSDVADISNLGGRVGGAITAGKFLENFVDYPWMHIDLAGPAFVESNKDYRQKGGTGYGVRLIYDFVKKNWL